MINIRKIVTGSLLSVSLLLPAAANGCEPVPGGWGRGDPTYHSCTLFGQCCPKGYRLVTKSERVRGKHGSYTRTRQVCVRVRR
jgi:hypothetical protein